ncbi:hypothetical protein [Geothrix sp. 21YS21S-2]|uniref:hypothetical protein n=1 Tax=Geothrix sp. 21YS21S-2 TaxID=3068893 RepID=UPI0027B92248|nr:hypothetical protein [Geothrix sp. 21YS21S-2]
MGHKLGRWAAPLAAGLVALLALAIAMAVRMRSAEAGLTSVMTSGFSLPPVKHFAFRFVTRLLLPFYLGAALLLWGSTLVLANAFQSGWSKTWRPLEGFLFTLSALVWVHLILWWQVPSTLWLIPGMRLLPFWVDYPLLLAASLAYPVLWIRKHGLGWLKGTALTACLLLAWSLLPWAPERLPRLLTTSLGGTDKTQVLLIGLDGLREDVGQAATTDWKGTSYTNAYTVIPATRLLWHILWGGDPLFYTIGHAPPTREELMGQQPLPVIDQAFKKAWRPRFYIDDGGTIGLTGKVASFDDVVMPAPGWENFVNSNLSSAFPLFADWENWGRAFPTTNPWAPLDGGLKEAIRLGRGAKLVMFHSCLAHQPIFLNREELAELPRWWTMVPRNLEPYLARQQVTVARAANYDLRRDPFTAYRIRMRSVLRAWSGIWNNLDRDPDYGGATKVLFSDHGERFYHVTETIRLGGVHGYDIDPWEARIMLKVDGPEFKAAPGAPPVASTVSVLSIRDALGEAIAKDRPLSRRTLETSYPTAPLRYQTLGRDLFTSDQIGLYREMTVERLAMQTAVAPDGIWFVNTDSTAKERAEEVTVAFARGSDLEVIKPLKAGGANKLFYQGYQLKAVDTVPEADYTAAKEKVMKILAPPAP